MIYYLIADNICIFLLIVVDSMQGTLGMYTVRRKLKYVIVNLLVLFEMAVECFYCKQVNKRRA